MLMANINTYMSSNRQNPEFHHKENKSMFFQKSLVYLIISLFLYQQIGVFIVAAANTRSIYR